MIKIIVAVDEKGAIGRNNELLYHIKDDLKNFKSLTSGNVVVMGRNTWESLPIKPLPNRENIVLTTTNKKLNGAKVINSFDELENYLKDTEKDIYIMGGASIYNQVMESKLVDEAHVSIDNLKELLPRENYVTTFEQDDLKADYIILSK